MRTHFLLKNRACYWKELGQTFLVSQQHFDSVACRPDFIVFKVNMRTFGTQLQLPLQMLPTVWVVGVELASGCMCRKLTLKS